MSQQEGISLWKGLAIVVPIAIIIVSVFSYVNYHDLSIDAKRHTSQWSCEQLEDWLNTEGKKFQPNMFKPAVEDAYEEKCSNDGVEGT